MVWEGIIESQRYAHESLLSFASALGEKAGLPPERARMQAEILLEADLMGHTTHGLALLPNYLKELSAGSMNADGQPVVLSDRGATVAWDGNRIAGTWLVTQAVDEGLRRIPQHGIVTFVISHSGHIGALTAYLRRATEQGCIMLLMTTNPLARSVVPAGGIDPVLAPNPIAFGSPTADGPILIDISTSTVANGWVRRWANEKKPLPADWLQDAEGNLTRDPAALFGSPPGALLPLGGIELGYKGFALGLIVEVLTGALTGVGHTGKPADAGNLVYLQLIDPGAFGDAAAFRQDGSNLAAACRASRPRPGSSGVRMPGDRALALRKAQLAEGIALYPPTIPDLLQWAGRLGVEPPAPLAGG